MASDRDQLGDRSDILRVLHFTLDSVLNPPLPPFRSLGNVHDLSGDDEAQFLLCANHSAKMAKSLK
jgi:hypothetical protein